MQTTQSPSRLYSQSRLQENHPDIRVCFSYLRVWFFAPETVTLILESFPLVIRNKSGFSDVPALEILLLLPPEALLLSRHSPWSTPFLVNSTASTLTAKTFLLSIHSFKVHSIQVWWSVAHWQPSKVSGNTFAWTSLHAWIIKEV